MIKNRCSEYPLALFVFKSYVFNYKQTVPQTNLTNSCHSVIISQIRHTLINTRHKFLPHNFKVKCRIFISMLNRNHFPAPQGVFSQQMNT